MTFNVQYLNTDILHEDEAYVYSLREVNYAHYYLHQFVWEL